MNLIQAALPSHTPEHIVKKGELVVIRERILQTLLVLVASATLLGYIFLSVTTLLQRDVGRFLFFTLLTSGVLGFIAFRRMPYIVRATLVVLTLLATSIYTFTLTGLNGNGKLYLLTFNALTAVLLGFRAGLISLVASQLGLGILGLMMVNGRIPLPPNAIAQGWTDTFEWTVTWIFLGILSSLVTVSLGLLINDLGKSYQQANLLSKNLQKESSSLQERVENRTREIQRRMRQIHTASDVSQTIVSIQDAEKQLPQVVELIRERFDLYYAGVFIVDKNNEAKLMAGTGEAGQKMVAAGHHLPVGGASMIGWAIANRHSRIALDVGAEAVRFNNPYLPETRSEMALPIIQRDQVLGALTIQSEVPQAFDEEDIRILEGIANSLAIALENTRLYQQAQDSLEEVRTLNRQYMLQAWTEVINESEDLQFTYESPDAKTGDNPNPIRLPLSIRDQVIGQVTLETDFSELTPDQVEMIDAITTQTALALENARLLQETRRRAVQEQTLNQLTSEFSRAISVDDILKSALRQLGKLPAVNEVSVHLMPPSSQKKKANLGNGNGNQGEPGKEHTS